MKIFHLLIFKFSTLIIMNVNTNDYLTLIKMKRVKILTDIINNNEYNKNIFIIDEINNWSILHYACFLKPSKKLNNLIKLLINIGLSINLKDKKGQTPIHLATLNNNYHIIEYVILNLNFNINNVDYDGDTLIINSCSLNFSKLSIFLIKLNANIHLHCKKNLTPLHWSCFHLNYEITEELIKNSGNLNIKNINGDTPLHFACMSFNHKFLQFLISKGGNIYIKNNHDISVNDLWNNINYFKKKNLNNILIKEQNWFNRKNYAFFLNSLKSSKYTNLTIKVFYNLDRIIASYL